ncbi:serine/threonine-protein phosphatase 6 regulatory subunit 2 isoform X2 [Oncorhynchus masou masou]|uniref:serine/threonine-protein phosphatase 6 regulatory subunit 2 isoform X2 n=1 Tax=Oncorhynchus masou masou TaxID=90313 RepID=UPI003182DD41
MFWKFDLHTSSQLEALLQKDDVTLTELMEEEDVLQECKAQNRRLLVFLSQDTCMQELLHLITTEPPAGLEEIKRFKHPNIACELLTSDVGVINDKLGGEKPLLDILYSFLEQPPPLNPLLASFFSKTIGNLITRKTEQVISFLRGKEGFLGLVLKHINTSAMMDLLLRLISCVDPAPLRQDTLNWLNEERLAQRLIELIHPGKDTERQSNASQTVCDIIRLSRDQTNQLQENSEADPLLAVLESQECVSQLLDNMFVGERTESCIVYGTQVLLTLLEIRRPGVEGVLDVCVLGYERCVVSSILQAVQPHLKHYHQLLLDPPRRTPMLTSLGVLEVPLGNCRLHVARLMASLLQTTNMSYYTCFDDTIYNNTVTLELCRLQTISLLLDLFFKYTWNNFLHFQVELCVAAILSHSAQEERPQVSLVIQERPLVPLEDIPQASFVAQEKPMFPQKENPQGSLPTQEKPRLQQEPQENHTLPGPKPPLPSVPPDISTHNPLVTHLFQDCRLVQRILEAWEENDKTQAEGGMRRGYMGHLTRIANTVVCNMEKGPVRIQISSLITELPKDCRGRWESFVDQALTETNRKNTVDLVSHNLRSSSEDDDRQSPFPKELSLQQTFSDYQIQQMTANFVDQFGFNDDEFSEHGDNISATFDRIKEINFNVDTEDTAKTAAFEACTKEKIQLFDDSEEEDIWEEREINYTMHTKSRTRFGGPQSDGMSDTPNKSTGSDTEGEVPNEVTGQTEHSKNISQTETAQSPGWAASFGEVNFNSPSSGVDPWGSPAPKPGVGVDPWVSPAPKPGVGVDPWGSPAPKPGVGVDPWGSPAPKPGVGVDPWGSPATKPGVGLDPWDSPAPKHGVAVDAWGSPAPQPVTTEAEKGWAKFTDFQPFCCSETGLRCTSPVDSEICGSDKAKPSQGRNPCVWSVCVARKAPLVASDTSSSGGSDSEEEEEKTESVTMEIVSKEMVTTETIVTTAGLETIRLNMNVKNERAGFNSEVDMKEKEKEKKRVMGGEDLLNATAAPLTDRPATVTKS